MGALTLSDTFRAFRTERSVSLSPTSLTSDWRQVENWLDRCPVQDLDRAREALAWVLQQQPAPSARRVAMYLRSLCAWAASEDVGLLPRNPVASFRLPKALQKASEIIVIPRRELPLVFASLERQDVIVRWELLAGFTFDLGLRTGEAFAARVEDIRGDRLLVHQNMTLTHSLKASTKNAKPRWVPINPRAQGILEKLTPVDGFLFPWNRYTYQGYFRRQMERLYHRKLISHRYRPYDLRHTAISGWLEAGVSVAQVAAWAGNSAQVIWAHYASTTQSYEMPVL